MAAAFGIERVGVVGGGQMGGGVAEVMAKAGLPTVVREISAEAAEKSQAGIERSLAKALERGKLDEDAHGATLANLSYTTEMADLAHCDLVVEAVVESFDLKAKIFADLDAVLASSEAILATNTSSIPIIDIAMSTARPEQVIGMHFFNPATIMKLVEVIPSVRTDASVTERITGFTTEVINKTVVAAQDRAGFVVNMLLVPYLLAAMKMYEAGYATAEDIDAGMKLGAAHPMGPLELSDMIGLDTMMLVGETLFEEYGDASYLPPPLLKRMVAAGHLGRKSGQGFYDYR
ncbi:MAG TPA: 3-hydroxybutyryl-CoA dehydrogenase [Acidimicrobiia bacterium]|jgi:3-hydroxybutyryl-CoA dehydrogenase|nr:3-hydroxybutyryl-CoA dehydrogenase [Actinomycetota bacterium]HIG25706.1 3-hydroxybutyryl-CoA dehydrogenase [Acidimicrobiia bacterium]MBT3747090.1 3-hydroxybutyryl-CoA dehydrogenase [Actinomycetota bacterium]MBT3968937.1 3-hydroxybutyryl-CoA dehydrogenase [Actinomycetota bacterium]MBT4009578.1 3-hydroxybutyryl-CoA dehydrogenase [Actinomycetota bacterium]